MFRPSRCASEHLAMREGPKHDVMLLSIYMQLAASPPSRSEHPAHASSWDGPAMWHVRPSNPATSLRCVAAWHGMHAVSGPGGVFGAQQDCHGPAAAPLAHAPHCTALRCAPRAV